MKIYSNLLYSSLLILILLISSSANIFALNLGTNQEEVIKFLEVENIPVFPGCKGTESNKRLCITNSLASLAQQYFDTSITVDLKLTGYQRISTAFNIDKKGNIINIRVRAPHPKLKEEAIRVINLFPKMKPGKQNGKPVSVEYLLPIIFKAAPLIKYNDKGVIISSEKSKLLFESNQEIESDSTLDITKDETKKKLLEKAPIFPGCKKKKNNLDRRNCMAFKISKFIQKEFNTDIAGKLGLSGKIRISIIFKVDTMGKIVDVRARAPHPKLAKEAVRAVSSLPMMEPATVDGKAVIVPYSLPIIFQLSNQSFVLPTTPD